MSTHGDEITTLDIESLKYVAHFHKSFGNVAASKAERLDKIARALPGLLEDRKRLDDMARLGLTVEPQGGHDSDRWIAYRYPLATAADIDGTLSDNPREAIDAARKEAP